MRQREGLPWEGLKERQGQIMRLSLRGKRANSNFKYPHARVEYRTWQAMLQRCRNPKATSWKNYGGRGIEVRFQSFEEFYAEVGPRPWAAPWDMANRHSIHRINNDGHYEKGNVTWTVGKIQSAPGNKRFPKKPPRTHCKRGHEMTPENTYVSKKGHRSCKECIGLHGARYNAESRLHTAARRLAQRLDGEPLVFLYGLPPLISHDCFPTGWPATIETAVALTEKVFEMQWRPVHTAREWHAAEWKRTRKAYYSHKTRPDPSPCSASA
jgi:hypothetical protein